MRHAATRALLERDDVIIVASVSCIYGIGSVETYSAMTFSIQVGDRVSQRQLLADLVAIQYKRNNLGFARGNFRVRGDTIEIFPAHQEDRAWRVSMFGDEVESIAEFDPLTGEKTQDLQLITVYSNSHYVTPKPTLAEFGFGLPSCIDNRPMRFEEWDAMRAQTVFVSATRSKWEMAQTGGVFVEQVIRPTGLIDPPVEIRPVKTQVDDLIDECRKVIKQGYRVLVTTLTKRMAEDLTEYAHEQGLKVRYMHSDVDTLERIEIIRDLRLGAFDVLIGINLLREGLDIPECALVAILDADKEGFLRSETSLVQT